MKKQTDSVSRNVILDLLPVYIAGEASKETRELIEQYAKNDEEIARLIKSGTLDPSASFSEESLPADLEMKTLQKVRRSIRWKMLQVALFTAGLLMIPLIAMQFTDEVQWDLADFVIMGLMLAGAGGMYVLISNLSDKKAYKLAIGIALVSCFLLVWISLAVGIIGAEDNPVNLLYGIVLAVAGIGSGVARFRSAGMARVMFIAAVMQFLVPFLALFILQPELQATQNLVGVFFLNTVLALLFAASGFLFLKAGREA
ncbi:MAG: hypothetical protein Kow0027_23810 [Saprospiraceae bacterium]